MQPGVRHQVRCIIAPGFCRYVRNAHKHTALARTYTQNGTNDTRLTIKARDKQACMQARRGESLRARGGQSSCSPLNIVNILPSSLPQLHNQRRRQAYRTGPAAPNIQTPLLWSDTHLLIFSCSQLSCTALARAVKGRLLPLLPLPLTGVFGLARPLALGFVRVTMTTGLEGRGASHSWLWGRRGGVPPGLLEATVT